MGAQVLELDESNFDAATRGVLAFVGFWVSHKRGKEIDQLLQAVADQAAAGVVVGRVCIDVSQKIAMRFNIMRVPCEVLLRDGQEVRYFVHLIRPSVVLEALGSAEPML